MSAESSPALPETRARRKTIAQRVGFVAQAAVAAAGGVGLWEAHVAGRAVSRASAIAFWAGLVGLVATFAGPRMRAFVRSRSSEHR